MLQRWIALAALASLAGCGTGEGGHITVPCDEGRCNDECVMGGSESGFCNGDDACVCVQPLDIPPGLSTALASGGVVEREGGGYQISLTVGPVSVGGTAMDGRDDLEVGPLPTTDPERSIEE